MNDISSTAGLSTQLPASIQSLVDVSRNNGGDENFSNMLASMKTTGGDAAMNAGSLATDGLKPVGSGDSKPVNNELEQIGRDFESIFFSLMLKEMRNSISGEEGGGLFAGEGSDTYGGMFDMFLGQHLADNAELGIGSQIESYLKNQHTSDAIEKVETHSGAESVSNQDKDS